jgi:hypothetical protein
LLAAHPATMKPTIVIPLLHTASCVQTMHTTAWSRNCLDEIIEQPLFFNRRSVQVGPGTNDYQPVLEDPGKVLGAASTTAYRPVDAASGPLSSTGVTGRAGDVMCDVCSQKFAKPITCRHMTKERKGLVPSPPMTMLIAQQLCRPVSLTSARYD